MTRIGFVLDPLGFDVGFFRRPWDSSLAYVLGYTWADGSVIESGSYLKVKYKCQEEDSKVIHDLKQLFRSHHKVSPKPEYTDRDGIHHKASVSLQITNTSFSRDLVRLHGVLPRKSELDLPFPEVPDEFLSHFCRGYFDGDGCVSSNWRGETLFSMHGTKRFIFALQTRMIEALGIMGNKVSRDGCCYSFGWGAVPDLKRIAKWFYLDDGGLFIPRKKEKMETV